MTLTRVVNGETETLTPAEEAALRAEWAANALTSPRRELPKSLVMARLMAAGQFAAVFAVLRSNDEAFAKWFAPDWPNVFADDKGMLAIFAAVGGIDVAAITARA